MWSQCLPPRLGSVWFRVGLVADVVSRFLRWPPRRPSWIAKRNNFSNSESLCRSDASHKVSAQSNLRLGRNCCLKNFKMAAMVSSWILKRNCLASLNLFVAPMPPITIRLNPTYGLVGEFVGRISRWRHLGYRNETILTILNVYVTPMPSIKFRLNLTYG